MKKINKLLAMLLCACFMITSLPLAVGAETQPETGSGKIYHVNPIYEGLVDSPRNLLSLDREIPTLQAEEYYTTMSAAGADLREQLKDRLDVVTVGISTTNSDAKEVCYGLMDEAMKHTGVPDEGDYIMWQYGGWEASYTYSTSSSRYRYTFSYDMEYYTTAAQENKVDQKLEQIFEELDLDGASDYKKIRGIYDYICENITYDYENLEDDSYKLKHSAYAGLINGTCVCQGYALILYRMALTMGIDCRLIAGSAGEAHGWNIAKLGDYYYNLDSTWDAGVSPYQYFLKGSSNFPGHYRYEEYTTSEFHSQYPTSTKDFVACEGSSDMDLHDYRLTRSEPTCTTEGSETEYCSVCGGKGNTTVLPALGHDYENFVCTRCGDTSCPKAGTCGDNVIWEILSDGTLLIYGTGAIYDDPSHSNVWFNAAKDIKSIVIRDGITDIGYGAFSGLNHVAKVTLPGTLKTIGNYAFSNCSAVTEITIPAGTASVGMGAFSRCTSLKTAVMPSGITALSNEIFTGCTSLTDFSIPGTVKTIGSQAFMGCSSLKSITVPSSVTTIGDLAFSSCGLRSVSFEGNVPSIASNAFSSVTCSAYYPQGNGTWTSSVKKNYGGSLAWRAEGEPLPTPVISAAVDADGNVSLTWNSVSGAVSYNVYRAEASGDFDHLDTVSKNKFTDKDVSVGHTYKYRVIAVAFDDSVSAESNTVSIKVTLPAPTIKSSNVESSGKIKLTWNKVEGAKEYKVYRALSKSGKYSAMKTVTGTSYTNTNAVPGKYYYYYVVAVSSDGTKSAKSNIVGRTCDYARPAVTATNDASTGKPKLTWKAVEGATSYKVYRSTTKNGTYSLMKTVKDGATSYINANAAAGKKYYYKVKAYGPNSSATSAYSTIDSRTCDLKRPTVKITTSSGKPKVSWAGITGATKYKIYRSTSKNGTYKVVKTTTSKSWKDTTAKKGKTYYYKVVAVHSNTNANSAYSNIVYKKCTK